MKFPVSTLPTVVVLSNLFVHLGLMAIVMAYVSIVEGYFLITWLQLPLYMVLLTIFSIFWSLFASPLSAISKDFHQLVKSVTRVMFWVSGIIWNVRNIETEWIRTLLMLNPINGFIEGYRDSLLYGSWFWEDWTRFLGLVGATVLMGVIAFVVYKRTRKEVVDTL
jgi:teichoic acid transport system permease protein